MTQLVLIRNADAEAEQIGELYRKARSSVADSVRYLIEAGARLIAKKESLNHGEWLPWLKANADVLGMNVTSTPQRLMKLAGKFGVNAEFAEDEAIRINRIAWGNNVRGTHGTGENEWFTPLEYIEAAREVLPRNITPSDVDVPNITMFDNHGLIIFCEFSRAFTDWNDIKFGQRLVYEGLIRHSSHCAVVGKHNVDPADERAIDSRLDIVSFQAMVWDFQIIRSKIIAGNQLWQDFIFNWFESGWGARKVRRQIIFKYGCGQ